MRVLHHAHQWRLWPEVAPVVAPLTVALIFPDQPADPPAAVGSNAPAAQGHHFGPQPAVAALAPADRPPPPLALGADQRIGPLGRRELPQRYAEVAAHGDYVTLLAQLQARQEIGVVAVVAVGGHGRVADAQFSGVIEQGQGNLGLGLERDVLGHLGLLAAGLIEGPLLGQIQPCGDGPGQGAFGVVTVDGHLAVARLAQGAGVLPLHADGALTLLGEAGVVEDEDRVAFAGKSPQGVDALVVEVVFVEGDAGQQVVQALLVGAGDDLGEGVAVLVVVLGQQAGEVAFQGLPPLGAAEVDVERAQEFVQLRQGRGRGMRFSRGSLHTSLYARPRQLTK